MQKIKVAIIGFGLSGKYFHLPFLKAHSGFEVVSILSSRENEIKEILPSCKVVSTIDEIVDDENIDLVINCGPNTLHYEYSKKALEAGKHVVVEKPFVVDSVEGEELIEIANNKGLVLTVFHNRRWDGDFLTVKHLIESGELGEVKEFESRFDRFRPDKKEGSWREENKPGSGILFDLGSHLIDQAIDLFGEPDRVISDIASQKNISGVDDYFHLIFVYKDLRVILHSTSFGDISPRFRVQGSKKSFIKYGLDPQEARLRSNINPLECTFGEDQKDHFGTLFDSVTGEKSQVPTLNGSYLEFFNQLYASICKGTQPPVDPRAALFVIKLIEEIKSKNSI